MISLISSIVYIYIKIINVFPDVQINISYSTRLDLPNGTLRDLIAAKHI